MKTKIRTSVLVIVLVILSTFVLKINAATPVPLSLTVQAGSLSCTNTGLVTFTNLNTSYSAQSQTWTFANDSRTCTDTRWTGRLTPWAQTVFLATNLNATGWSSIAAANVKMSTTYSTSFWNLTWTTSWATLVAINNTQDIYRKKTTAWTGIGIFIATPTIVINVDANQAPWVYTWTVTVTDPS